METSKTDLKSSAEKVGQIVTQIITSIAGVKKLKFSRKRGVKTKST